MVSREHDRRNIRHPWQSADQGECRGTEARPGTRLASPGSGGRVPTSRIPKARGPLAPRGERKQKVSAFLKGKNSSCQRNCLSPHKFSYLWKRQGNESRYFMTSRAECHPLAPLCKGSCPRSGLRDCKAGVLTSACLELFRLQPLSRGYRPRQRSSQ